MFESQDSPSRPLIARQFVDSDTGIIYLADPPNGTQRYTGDARPNLHSQLAATAISVTIVAFLTVALRVFTRIHVTKSGLAMDDYMVLIAMALSFGLLGMNFKHMAVGLGYHSWDIPMTDYMVPFQIYTLAGTMVYSLSLAFSKISILFLYLRLSTVRWFRLLVWILLGIVIAYAIIYNLMSLFGCRPIAASWDLSLATTAKCLDQLTKYMALSVLNIIIDVFELVLPIPIVVPLQMSNRQKASVCLMFATGIFVCAAALKRTLLLKPLMTAPDYTWAAVEQFQWCFVEVNAGVVCASVPALKSFFARYLPGLISSRLRSHDRSKNTDGYNTIEKGNQRPKAKKDVYEMTVVEDDVSSEKTVQPPNVNDDEARLWEGDGVRANASSNLSKPALSHVQTPTLGRDSEGSRIYVTSKTTVEYGDR
ncbi:hypothetical protein P171DRAFT_524396 [Karstenula rhodostoma CBS 690.94]|uniref:Rhodopsin domain-containing protein n=1 Tax=Karstenula rhodostoma CBS 690.94 TaxID=1392251 RepID=A0A9P4P8D8_9PLEO|nr:hypothetical protein P171DRAFT_524396 [Karstenula rhodostoma CBS 690.94]